MKLSDEIANTEDEAIMSEPSLLIGWADEAALMEKRIAELESSSNKLLAQRDAAEQERDQLQKQAHCGYREQHYPITVCDKCGWVSKALKQGDL